MDSSSAIHLASVSKTFTAMAILKLAEEGKLSLNDEAALHLKGFPYPGVTIKNMLNHRSGLPNYVHFMEDPGTGMSRPVSNQDILQYMSRNKAKLSITRPDTHFSYSNTNYALLALIIEKVSGKTYAQYLKETFFRPLGMDNTFVFSTDKADYVIPSYDWRNRQIAFSFLDAVYGDKNIYSTPRDLLKWDQALYTDQLFRKETLDMAFAGYSFEKPGKRNYGLGWRLYEFPGGKKVIYHNGWWHGNNVVFSRLPQDSATIIVMGNKFTRRIYEARKIYTAFEGYGRADDGDE
jgi:CubicO group peptidase (beta-lactamase class C family)